MKKIPAGRVITAAYRFVLRDRTTLARLLFLPVFVIVLAPYLLDFLRALPLLTLPELARERPVLVYFVPFILVLVTVLVSIVLAASIVLQHVLLVPETGVPARYCFGRDEWRLAKATVWYLLLLILVGALGAALGYGIGITLENFAPDSAFAWENMPLHAAVVCGILGLLYPMIAIGILLYPMVLFEKNSGIRFTCSWSEGNLWPLSIIFLATSAPFWAVWFSTGWMSGQWLFPLSEIADIGFLIVSGTVIGIFGYSLVFVASAFAYESLLPDESDTPISET